MADRNTMAETAAIQVENLTRNKTLVTAGRAADGYWSRLRGLIGHPPLAGGQGLLIVPCSSIHTHFMRFPIDVLYVDRQLNVVDVDHSLVPWRFGSMRRGVHFVIELPAGVAKQTGTQPGDRLALHGYELK